LTQDDTEEMTRLSQIPILDGEEWSLMEAMDLSIDAALAFPQISRHLRCETEMERWTCKKPSTRLNSRLRLSSKW
jgi:hypothetical protein